MLDRFAPNDNVVVLAVQFTAYETLLSEVGDNAGARIAYDGEFLELISASADHERYNRLLESLIVTLGLEWNIDIESAGSMTLKVRPHGAEPDSCFYVGNAPRVIGKREIDLAIDPPPDIAVEIDKSRARIDKRKIYATIGVPELWRYDGDTLRAFRLDAGTYRQVERSAALEGLSIVELGNFLERRATIGQSEILRSWQQWLRSNRPNKDPS
jgi:Uma2 family endonuclease